MPKRRPPRVALVGCGDLSTRAYMPTLRWAHRYGRCRWAALCDLNADLVAERAAQFKVPRTYTDVAELVEAETLDGIFVVVSVGATARVAGLTLKRGLPTYLEKPPGRTAKECEALIRAAASSGAPNQVAFNRRYTPPIRLLRDRMQRYGGIHSASAVMYRYRRLEPTFIVSTAIHALDALRFLAGDITRAQARRTRLPDGDADSFIIDIDYATGGFGTLDVLPDVGVRAERYTAHGPRTTGFAQVPGPRNCIDDPGACQLYHAGKPVRLPNPFGRRRDVPTPIACGFHAEILAFLTCLTTDATPAPSLAESLQSLEVLEVISKNRTYRLR